MLPCGIRTMSNRFHHHRFARTLLSKTSKGTRMTTEVSRREAFIMRNSPAGKQKARDSVSDIGLLHFQILDRLNEDFIPFYIFYSRVRIS